MWILHFFWIVKTAMWNLLEHGAFQCKDDCLSFINGLLEPHLCSTPPLPFSHVVQRQLENLKSGFSCWGGFTHFKYAYFLLLFDTCLLAVQFYFPPPSPPAPRPISHYTICMVWEKEKNTLGQNHQQHHCDVLFLQRASLTTCFLVTSLKSTQRRQKLGAFIKTQPFSAPLFVWPDSYHCTQSPRTTKLCLKAKLLISCWNVL